MIKLLFIAGFLVLLPLFWNDDAALLAQDKKIDSLEHVLKTLSGTDQNLEKLKVLNKLSRSVYLNGAYEEGLRYARFVLSLADKMKEGYEREVERARAYNNIGNVYFSQGNYPLSLENHLEALSIQEKIGEKKGMAASYHNIGNIHINQDNNTEALKDYEASLKIKESMGDQKGVANSYNSIGAVYASLERYKEALDNFRLALEIEKIIGDERGMGNSYNNMGAVNKETGDYAEGLKNSFLALGIYQRTDNKESIALSLGNIGILYTRLKKYSEADPYLQKALKLSTELGALELMREHYRNLTEVCENSGRSHEALKYYKAMIQVGDSLQNEDNTRKLVKMEMNYEFDKKEMAAKLEQEKKEVIAMAESRRQKIILMAISALGFFILVFALFIYRSYLQKQRANVEITKQKEVIEEKQKEILDSIHYAKRIQQALITSERYIEKNIARLARDT